MADIDGIGRELLVDLLHKEKNLIPWDMLGEGVQARAISLTGFPQSSPMVIASLSDCSGWTSSMLGKGAHGG